MCSRSCDTLLQILQISAGTLCTRSAYIWDTLGKVGKVGKLGKVDAQGKSMATANPANQRRHALHTRFTRNFDLGFEVRGAGACARTSCVCVCGLDAYIFFLYLIFFERNINSMNSVRMCV